MGAADLQMDLFQSEGVGGPMYVALTPDTVMRSKDFDLLELKEKAERAMAAIDRVFSKDRPCAVAWSGGKDSTVLLALVLETARRRVERGMECPPVVVTHARTGVENPAMDMVARTEMQRASEYCKNHGIPATFDVAEPSLNDTWAVRIISGRALPTFPNSPTRDCSVSWKILPQKRQRGRVLESLGAHGRPVVMTGTRYEESTSRAQRMEERGESDEEIWHQISKGSDGKVVSMEDRLSPIARWTQEDVWVFLSELMRGVREGYTDAEAIWETYKDGGNSSCAVVGDDALKAGAKACGARFGCAVCVAVGRDKSLEAMLEADPKYGYMLGLNKLQRFIADTQYDLGRRQWLGRTVTEDGYLAFGPDAYSPSMQRELLRYALTVDRREEVAAAQLGISPRFRLITLEQIAAIDCIWAVQGSQPRGFEALRIWSEVYCHGKEWDPPQVDVASLPKKIPAQRWLHVGPQPEGFASNPFAGARDLMADVSGATEGPCSPLRELSDGRVVMDLAGSDYFSIDSEGLMDFIQFEGYDMLTSPEHAKNPRAAFDVLSRYGVVSTSTRHLGTIDEILKRSAWRRSLGLDKLTAQEMAIRTVSTRERGAGLETPRTPVSFDQILSSSRDRGESLCNGPIV